MPPLWGEIRQTARFIEDGRGNLICPDCGTREALASIGVEPEEQEQILAAIHRSEQ